MLKKAKLLVEKHQGHIRRKSGDPYTQHLWNVLETLSRYDLPEELLVAGVLHDIIEDSPLTQRDISDQFGKRVSFIVSALSKSQKPPQPDTYKNPLKKESVISPEFYSKLSKIESQNFRFLGYINKFFYSVIADPWIAFIKIADQIDNLRDIEIFSPEKSRRKIEEIHFYFWPIYERITEKNVMSHEVSQPYEEIKKELWNILEQKKKELNIDLEAIHPKKNA